MAVRLSSLPFHGDSQISSVFAKYATNLRRLFWCISALTFSLVVFAFGYILSALEVVDRESWLLTVPALVMLASVVAYLWVKADCLDFDLSLSFTHWLNIGCLLDFLAVIVRFGGRWIGMPDIGRSVASILGMAGLLAFIWFLTELAKLLKAEKQVSQSQIAFWSYAVCGLLGLGIRACMFFKIEVPFVVLGLALPMLVLWVLGSIQFVLLLFQLSSALREFANSILLQEHSDGIDHDEDSDYSEKLETI